MNVDGDRYNPDAYARRVVAETSAALPGPGDPYKAAPSPENTELSRLVLIMGKDGFKPGGTAYIFLQYVHLGSGEFGFDSDGQFFRFVFSDLAPKRATVRGRNLLNLCDAIAQRRMPWIRQADRDFRSSNGAPGDEPFITRIDVEDWQPEQGQDQTGEDAPG
jgi:hypothetical protein